MLSLLYRTYNIFPKNISQIANFTEKKPHNITLIILVIIILGQMVNIYDQELPIIQQSEMKGRG